MKYKFCSTCTNSFFTLFSWILIRIFWIGSGFLDPDSEKKSDLDPEQNGFNTLLFSWVQIRIGQKSWSDSENPDPDPCKNVQKLQVLVQTEKKLSYLAPSSSDLVGR